MANSERYYQTGKRKAAIARVWLTPGSGLITVNQRSFDTYFRLDTHQRIIREPLELTNTGDQYDVLVTVRGGGITGQADAIRHGISKAIIQADETQRRVLKRAGFLTRDARVKERKKYGQKKARKRFQYSKR